MKAEHRHELKTNDLAKTLLTFQDYVKVYGGRVALGVAIVILLVVLIMQRINSSHTAADRARDDLAYARTQIDRVNHAFVTFEGRPSVAPAEVETVPRLLQQVRDTASDKAVLAAAVVAQGDYAWAMANFPPSPAATSQPSLRPAPDHDYIKEARNAYQEVLSQYPDQLLSAIAAHFGLAAIAENEGNWDEARRQYEVVKSMGDNMQTFKLLADGKLKRLEEIRKPLLIGQVPEKMEIPQPPATGATTQATTQPAARPATSPTTKPVR
jgi:hypothetical protein